MTVTDTTDDTAARSSTAPWTGMFYLLLAIAGLIGFLLVRAELYIADDPAATLSNLVDRVGLARVGIAADLTVVLAQALAAVWCFSLFRDTHRLAALSISAFGLINATAILAATALSASALAVAGNVSLAPAGDQAATVQLLYELNGALWDVGGLFFGLWLFPMGYAVMKSPDMPRVLGWVLMTGAVGYVLNTYLLHITPDAPGIVEGLLVGIATIGEFWMIGYLLAAAMRRRRPQH